MIIKKIKKGTHLILSHISSQTIKLMNYFLPFLLAEFIWFVISFYIEMKADALRAIYVYRGIAEHLMMSLLILIVCSVLFDISIHESDN